jgi:hypothetical protein
MKPKSGARWLRRPAPSRSNLGFRSGQTEPFPAAGVAVHPGQRPPSNRAEEPAPSGAREINVILSERNRRHQEALVIISKRRKSSVGTPALKPTGRLAQRRPIKTARLHGLPLRVNSTEPQRRHFLYLRWAPSLFRLCRRAHGGKPTRRSRCG